MEEIRCMKKCKYVVLLSDSEYPYAALFCLIAICGKDGWKYKLHSVHRLPPQPISLRLRGAFLPPQEHNTQVLEVHH